MPALAPTILARNDFIRIGLHGTWIRMSAIIAIAQETHSVRVFMAGDKDWTNFPADGKPDSEIAYKKIVDNVVGRVQQS